MASVLNRTTKQFLASVNTPDYPTTDWIINPDLTAVAGFPSKYWSISGNTVSLMDAGQRAAVDAAELAAQRDAIAAQMDLVEGYARAFALVVLDEINLHAQRVTAVLNAIDNGATLAAIKTDVAAIADVPTRTAAELKTALRNKLGT